MKWITHERPKIDRITCPWLIKRFIDKDAEIFYVPFEQVLVNAQVLKATAFGLPGIEFTHCSSDGTFDYFIKKYKIKDEAILALAPMVRSADTYNHKLALQYSRLLAIADRMSFNMANDEDGVSACTQVKMKQVHSTLDSLYNLL